MPRVLIADDDKIVRIMIKKILSDFKCEIVAEAQNGEEAVDFFIKYSPDVVLLDLKMPKKDGIESLKEIKAISKDAVIIILTSVSDMKEIEKCFDLGIENYIRKDLGANEIRRIFEITCKKMSEKLDKNTADNACDA
ncbi:MAG: response regulator transcription factor [Candidatus Gastranaerophilales bacterium]|nr:response regulator transcription factor [Candidatus Gastranaerophilales bacterium]